MQRDPETFAIIGAAMEVHRELGRNELKATGLQRGLLLNFGTTSLKHRRLVFGPSENLCQSAKSVDEIYL